MTARPTGLALLALCLVLSLGSAAATPPAFTLKGQLEGPGGEVRVVGFSADNRFLLAGDSSGNVQVYEADGRKKTTSFDTRHGTLNALVVSTATGLAATTGKDGKIRVWDPATGRLVREIKASDDPLYALAFDGTGTALASGGEDKVLRVHDPESGLLQTELKGHDDTIRGVAFVDGGKGLLSCASDKTIRLWDLPSRRETRNQTERAAEYGDLNGFAVSPAGGHFVTLARELKKAGGGIRTLGGRGGSNVMENNVLLVRDLASWAEQGRLEGHLRAIHRAAFSPDGSVIASVSDDQALILWDREAKTKLLAFDQPDKLWAVAFSPDGRWLAAGGDEKKVYLYFVKWPPSEKPVAAVAKPGAAKEPAAAAANEPPPTPAEAKGLYDQGRREFNLGHYTEALALFERAYKAQPVHKLLYNIGQCHRLLGNLEQAKRVYRAFIAEAPEGEAMVPQVQEKLAEIEGALKAQSAARESAPSGLASEKEKEKAPPPKK
jgi:hypothetical protein